MLPAAPTKATFSAPWQVLQRMPATPKSAGPRRTGGWCGRMASPCRGVSPRGWQLTQRGWVTTLPISSNRARLRAVSSAMPAKASGPFSVSAGRACCCAAAGDRQAAASSRAPAAVRRCGTAQPPIMRPERNGRRRTARPVSRRQALATAGPTGGTPGSPTPVGGSADSTIATSTAGISWIRIER